jgi:hypothetical protein
VLVLRFCGADVTSVSSRGHLVGGVRVNGDNQDDYGRRGWNGASHGKLESHRWLYGVWSS